MGLDDDQQLYTETRLVYVSFVVWLTYGCGQISYLFWFVFSKFIELENNAGNLTLINLLDAHK